MYCIVIEQGLHVRTIWTHILTKFYGVPRICLFPAFGESGISTSYRQGLFVGITQVFFTQLCVPSVTKTNPAGQKGCGSTTPHNSVNFGKINDWYKNRLRVWPQDFKDRGHRWDFAISATLGPETLQRSVDRLAGNTEVSCRKQQKTSVTRVDLV